MSPELPSHRTETAREREVGSFEQHGRVGELLARARRQVRREVEPFEGFGDHEVPDLARAAEVGKEECFIFPRPLFPPITQRQTRQEWERS